jgi:WD40 repeat protein
MSHIFISYSRKDIDFAQKIVTILAENNLDTWIDWKSIPKGEKWLDEIYFGIEGADAFLFLISPDSVKSEYCNKEIDHAVKNGKRILPIVIRDTDRKDIHPEINKRNWVFCREGEDDFNKVIEETHNTIHTDYEWLKYHTRLQVKALEWERNQDASRLLRGKELKEEEQRFAIITSQKDPQPTDLQRIFIQESREHTRTTRRRNSMVLILVILTISFLSASSYFLWEYSNNESLRANQEATQRSVAELAESEARANQIAVQAENKIMGNGDVVEAAQLILNSDQVISSFEIKKATYLLSALPMPDKILEDLGNEISDAEINRQNTLILTVGIDGGHAIVWDTGNGEALFSLPITRISSAKFSPDGKKVISTDWGNRIRVWNANNGFQVYSVDGYGGKLENSNFAQTDPYVVYPCETHFICILNYDTGEQQYKIDTQVDRVATAGFGLDDSLVIVGSDQKINILDARNGTLIRSMVSNPCGDIALSPQGYWLACESYNGKITIWDYMTGEQVAVFENANFENGGEGLVRANLSVTFSSAGRMIGMTTAHGEAAILNIDQGSQVKLETQDVVSLDFDPDGKTIITGHLDGTARIWNTGSGVELIKLQSHNDVVLSAHFIAGNKVVTTSVDGTARVWNLTPLNLIQNISTREFISKSEFSHSAETIALVTSNNTVLIWNVKNDSKIFVLDGHEEDIVSIDFSFDDQYLVSASRDGTFRIWDLSNGTSVKAIDWHQNDVLSAKFSSDGKYIVSASLDGNACLWDAKSGDLVHTFMGHESGVFYTGFNQDGSELLTIDYSGVIGHWDVSKGELIRFYKMEASGLDSAFNLGYVSAVFSEDGRMITAVGKDEVARVWNADTGEQVALFWDHPGITSVLFSPEGDELLTYGADNVLRIWDISSGDMDMELIGHSGESDTTISAGIVSVRYSQSGKEIISIGRDDTLRIWDLEKGQSLAVLSMSRTYSASISADGMKIGAYDYFGNFNILSIDYEGLIGSIKLRLDVLGIQ